MFCARKGGVVALVQPGDDGRKALALPAPSGQEDEEISAGVTVTGATSGDTSVASDIGFGPAAERMRRTGPRMKKTGSRAVISISEA